MRSPIIKNGGDLIQIDHIDAWKVSAVFAIYVADKIPFILEGLSTLAFR